MGSVSMVKDNASWFADTFGWMGDLMGGLGYFLGGDFQKALAKGFMG